jgi:hypothetical protein
VNVAVVSLTSHFSTTQCLRLKHALEAKRWFGVDFLDSLFGLWLLPWFRQILIRHCEISPEKFSERLELFPELYRHRFWVQGS